MQRPLVRVVPAVAAGEAKALAVLGACIGDAGIEQVHMAGEAPWNGPRSRVIAAGFPFDVKAWSATDRTVRRRLPPVYRL